MLRFEVPQERRSRNYLARREQGRLFALLVGLGAVILLIVQLSGTQNLEVDGEATATIAEPVPTATDAKPTVVDRERLSEVRDNSHFRNEETDAWFYLFSLLSGSEGAIPSVPEVTYTQLVAQPHVYRGELVRVEGQIQRIEAVTPAKNELGIEKLYRVLLKPKGPAQWPITAYCLTLPAGWTVGEPPGNRVEVVGYFFKNLSYASHDGMALTPVIVSQSFSVRELAATAKPMDSDPIPIGRIFSVAFLVATAIVALVIWRTSSQDLETVEEDHADVEDALRRLAREGE